MEFTEPQRHDIKRLGYTKLPGFVPARLVDRAVRAINHSMGEGIDLAQLPTLRAQSYCPELKSSPIITDLFNATGLHELAESLIGANTFPAIDSAQIALRFPRADDVLPEFRPHLDGLPTMTNGVPSGTIGSFTALVGILLSDLPRPNAGNFTVLPGSHEATATFFREQGPHTFLDGFPTIPPVEPVQITGAPGDVVFCHYQLGHGIAPNVSPHIRYAVFFRIRHRNHGEDIEGRLVDIWRDWPGMRD